MNPDWNTVADDQLGSRKMVSGAIETTAECCMWIVPSSNLQPVCSLHAMAHLMELVHLTSSVVRHFVKVLPEKENSSHKFHSQDL